MVLIGPTVSTPVLLSDLRIRPASPPNTDRALSPSHGAVTEQDNASWTGRTFSYLSCGTPCLVPFHRQTVGSLMTSSELLSEGVKPSC